MSQISRSNQLFTKKNIDVDEEIYEEEKVPNETSSLKSLSACDLAATQQQLVLPTNEEYDMQGLNAEFAHEANNTATLGSFQQ